MRDLRSFIAEAELRLPKVQSQIIALDTVDIDKGWDEALVSGTLDITIGDGGRRKAADENPS